MKRLTTLAILGLGVLCSGCITVSLIHVGDNQTIGEGDAQMESNADIADSFTDLLKSSTATSLTPPDPIDDENAPPPVIDPPPQTNGVVGAHSALWKPISETTGNLVLVLDEEYTGHTTGVTVAGEAGRFASVANGNREHYRWGKPGADFTEMATIVVTTDTGAEHVGYVPVPAEREQITLAVRP